MTWIQDSIKQQEITVKRPEGEGQAEVIEVFATHEGFVSPGQIVPVGGGMRNVGGQDNMRFVICFLEPYLQDFPEEDVYMEKIETQATNGEIWISGTLTVPAGYTGATVTLVAIGYHEE